MGLIILLILSGILLILLEVFVIPGVGAAGIFGLASLVGASCYAFSFSNVLGLSVTLVCIALVGGFMAFCLRAKTWKRFELKESIDTKVTPRPTAEPGMTGVAVTRLAPMGTARIGDKTCEVTSLCGMVDAGSPVQVERVENNKVYVKIQIS